MKRIILGCLICILIAPVYAQQDFGINANRNFDFGLRGGLNLSSLNNESSFDSKRLIGLHVGFFGRYNLTERVGIRGELIYSMQGARSDDFIIFEDFAINLNYLKIPLLAEVTFGPLSFELGPYLGILLVSRQSFKDLDTTNGSNIDLNQSDANSLDLGIAIGLGYRITDRVGVGVRYNQGFFDALGDDFFGSSSGKTSIFQISTTYLLE